MILSSPFSIHTQLQSQVKPTAGGLLLSCRQILQPCPCQGLVLGPVACVKAGEILSLKNNPICQKVRAWAKLTKTEMCKQVENINL